MPSIEDSIPKPRPSPILLLSLSTVAAILVLFVAVAVLHTLQNILPGGLPFATADSAMWWASTNGGLKP